MSLEVLEVVQVLVEVTVGASEGEMAAAEVAFDSLRSMEAVELGPQRALAALHSGLYLSVPDWWELVEPALLASDYL